MTLSTLTIRPAMRPAAYPTALLLLPLTLPALAQPSEAVPEVQLEKVEIRGRAPSTIELRRESTAAKIVVGREEIDRYGDSTVTDVLKRLPGVTLGGTPGRGGEIRMRGMGSGYTQILINGERAPGGFSVDTLTPEQVERIEVMRAPTAEFGAQAIAGTINIVLRDDVRRRLNTLHLTLGRVDDRWQPALNWTRADRIERFSYNLSASAYRRDRADTVNTHTEAPGYVRDEQRRGRSLREGVTLGGRLQWKLDEGHTLALQSFGMIHSERDLQGTQRQQTAGTDPVGYDTSFSHTRGHFAMARSTAEWQMRLPDAARLETSVGLTAMESVSAIHRTESLLGSTTRLLDDTSDAQERWRSLRGKYSRWFDADNQLALGWEAEASHRDATRDTSQVPLAVTTARTLRTALWGQDEWKLSPQWALHGGVRWEAITTRSDWLSSSQWLDSRNRSAVWSPLFHVLWRPDEQAKDQVRLSLTRSYRAPRPSQLTAQRIYTRDTDVAGGNSPNNPDSLGNPALRPELSTGLDLAYEHYLPGGGLLSASVFHRQITDYIRNVISLESGTGRYITQPRNIGSATTTGLELEAKFRLPELVPTLDWPLDLRSNVSFFRSQVRDVPGPDNRLDRQPPYTANLGADYRMRTWPLQVGSSLTLQPGHPLQVSDVQRNYEGLRRVVDAYALWTFNPNTALRLSASNLWARSSVSASSYGNGYASRSVEDTTTLASLRLELKL